MKNNFKLKLINLRYVYRITKNEISTYFCKENNKKNRLEAEMLVYAHSLEKGMGLKKVKKGYGQEKAKHLLTLLDKYLSQNYSIDNYAFGETISILNRYFEELHQQNVDIKDIETKFIFMKNSLPVFTNYKAGYELLHKDQLKSGIDFDFEKFIESRHSMRMYINDAISEDDIKCVINLANKAPSACNRQPAKVYYTSNQEKARCFEKMIAGSMSFEDEIPYFMVVTEDRKYFVHEEFLQWYVNGGIYLSFLTLAFHSLGIGSIIMQYKFSNSNEANVRKFMNIPDNEAIIAIVGYGKYDINNSKYVIASRKNAEDVIVKI